MEWKVYIEIGNEIFVMQHLRADIQCGLDIFCDFKLYDTKYTEWVRVEEKATADEIMIS